jgi:hypothetical protein
MNRPSTCRWKPSSFTTDLITFALPGEIPTAEPANIPRDFSVVDNLAVAASRLREQDAQIKTLQSEVNTITHPPNAFYVDTAIVATALGSVQRTDKTLRVQL